MHRANETRPVLDGMAKVAERTGASILLVRHLAKSSSGRSVHSGLGSIDIVGAMRSEVLVGCAPDDRTNCALIHDKPGICRRGDSLRFSIDSAVVDGTDGKPIKTAGVTWRGVSYLTAADLRAPEDATRHMTKDARTWLRDRLAAGPRLISELTAEWAAVSGQELKNAERTLQRAAVGVIGPKQRRCGKGGPWEWKLSGPRKFEAAAAGVEVRGRTHGRDGETPRGAVPV